MSEMRLRLLDSPFVVDADDDAIGRLRRQWSRCLDHGPDAEPLVRLTLASGDRDLSEYSLTSSLTGAAIGSRAGQLMMLHACGVADRQTGRTAVLAAGSGTGKTTAAKTLCSRDFGYVSDETVAFDIDGSITPYPKPLSVILGAGTGKSQHSPDELGLQPAPDRCRVGFLAVLERSQADSVVVESLSLIDGLVALIPHSSALPMLRNPLWELASRVQATGGVRRIRYGEAASLGPVVAAELARAVIPMPDFTHLPPNGGSGALGQSPGARAGELRRAPYDDAVATPGDVLLLADASPFRLQGASASVWMALDRPRPLDELIETCVARFGDHPDVDKLVRGAVRQLLENGRIETAG